MKPNAFFTKLKSFFCGLFKRTANLYERLDVDTRHLVRLAVRVVQGLKAVTVDSPVDDVVAFVLGRVFPAYAPAITGLQQKLEKQIPVWLTELTVAEQLLSKTSGQQPTDAESLLAIVQALNISPTKDGTYLHFATQCLYYLNGGDNGKLDWPDCQAIVQLYYDNYVKTNRD